MELTADEIVEIVNEERYRLRKRFMEDYRQLPEIVYAASPQEFRQQCESVCEHWFRERGVRYYYPTDPATYEKDTLAAYDMLSHRVLINMERLVTAVRDDNDVRDVIRHELAHAFIGQDEREAHDDKWRLKCVEFGGLPQGHVDFDANGKMMFVD